MTIEEKIRTMIEEEKKRREIAIDWLLSITPILCEYGEAKYGEGVKNAGGELDTAFWIPDHSGELSDYYFRYKGDVGLRIAKISDFNIFNGKLLQEIKGESFWTGIDYFLNFLDKELNLDNSNTI